MFFCCMSLDLRITAEPVQRITYNYYRIAIFDCLVDGKMVGILVAYNMSERISWIVG